MADKVSEELDYHITFPTPLPQNFPDIEETEKESPPSVEKELVVILLGWTGCKDRYLSKYSAIYDQKGCITIRYTAVTENFFLHEQRLRHLSGKILELILDLDLEENPILFHVMSNGGGFLYSYIAELLHADPQYASIMPQVKGVVFDSCPSEPSFTNAAKVCFNTMEGSIIFRCLITIYITFLLLLGSLKDCIATYTGGTVRYNFKALKNDPMRCPQLFLYSKADNLVNYKHVEKHIEWLRQRGVVVKTMCWDDSAHVQHFRIHREAYMQQCFDFVELCSQNSS